MTTEERVSRLEGIAETVGDRLNGIDSQLASLSASLNNRMERLEAKVDVNFRWTIGIMVTLWATVMLAVLLRT